LVQKVYKICFQCLNTNSKNRHKLCDLFIKSLSKTIPNKLNIKGVQARNALLQELRERLPKLAWPTQFAYVDHSLILIFQKWNSDMFPTIFGRKIQRENWNVIFLPIFLKSKQEIPIYLTHLYQWRHILWRHRDVYVFAKLRECAISISLSSIECIQYHEQNCLSLGINKN